MAVLAGTRRLRPNVTQLTPSGCVCSKEVNQTPEAEPCA